MALMIALAAAPFTKELPVVGHQCRFGNAHLQKEIEVPRFLALRDGIPAGMLAIRIGRDVVLDVSA